VFILSRSSRWPRDPHRRFPSAKCSRSVTPRITIHSERELTVEIAAGDNIGFSDTVEYEQSRFAMA